MFSIRPNVFRHKIRIQTDSHALKWQKSTRNVNKWKHWRKFLNDSFLVWWKKLVVIDASEAIRKSVEILLNNYANYAIIFTRLLDNSWQIWFAEFPPASACSWLIDRPAKLGLWLAGKKPFYSSTLVMSKREGLWSENKQIIVSLKATWLHQSPENYMWAERMKHWKLHQ